VGIKNTRTSYPLGKYHDLKKCMMVGDWLNFGRASYNRLIVIADFLNHDISFVETKIHHHGHILIHYNFWHQILHSCGHCHDAGELTAATHSPIGISLLLQKELLWLIVRFALWRSLPHCTKYFVVETYRKGIVQSSCSAHHDNNNNSIKHWGLMSSHLPMGFTWVQNNVRICGW